MRIRVPSLYLGWLPVEIEVGERTVRLVAGFSIKPLVNRAEAYEYLLRLNMRSPGFSFGIDGEDRICLVGRLRTAALNPAALDAAFGRIVEITQEAVASYVRLGLRPAAPSTIVAERPSEGV